MTNFINATIKAAREIIEILKRRDSALYEKKQRGAGGDISIGADLVSENIYIKFLSEFGNIDSEECGFIDNKKPRTIILDPLDGSDNFTSHIPYYGASIALKDISGEILVGIIINYCINEAVIGFGAGELKGKVFRGNLALEFERFSEIDINAKTPKCGIFERAYKYPQICALLNDNGIKFRSLGAYALSLSLANEVSFVLGFGEQRHYDSLAGEPIVQNLHKLENKNFILISKDKKLFDKIANILSNQN